MIINLVGSVDADGTIDFDLPCIYFSLNQSVKVNQFFIYHQKSVREIHGYLSSTLIDKSPINQRQQIMFLYQPEKSRFFFYSPTHPEKYKIQTQNFSSAVFQLHLSEEEKKYVFSGRKKEKIYLQLEIESDARLFRNYSKPL